MGTTYQTTCGCYTSSPEPSPCEYHTEEEYRAEWARWDEEWQRVCEKHDPWCDRRP